MFRSRLGFWQLGAGGEAVDSRALASDLEAPPLQRKGCSCGKIITQLILTAVSVPPGFLDHGVLECQPCWS